MNYSKALDALTIGHRVRRAGWNGKGMWIMHIGSWRAELPAQMAANGQEPFKGWRGYSPFIAMFTADKFLVPWLCSQTDMLANDWSIVE